MVQVDIHKFLNLEVEEITESVKEDFYPQLCDLEIQNVSMQYVHDICKLMQEILKFKGEQVDSLVTELDSLASRQGEEEAYIQSLVDEIEELKLKLGSSSDTHKTVSASDLDPDGMRREIVNMEIANDRLIVELQEKEEELISEKREIEKLSAKLSGVEKENRCLKEELLQTQQELAAFSDSKLRLDSPDQSSIQKYHELTELLHQKNSHISQLLLDIEELEKENLTLKKKFSIVQEEMIEGMQHMSQLSSERIQFTTTIEELKEKLNTLEQVNAGLRNQVSELISDKEIHDKQLENWSLALDSRIQQWKEILDKKDSEIFSLKSQAREQPVRSDIDPMYFSRLSELTQTVEKQEIQIEELKEQLKQATIDLNESAVLLEKHKLISQSKLEKDIESRTIKKMRKKLEHMESRVVVLEGKLKHAEDDALNKAEEVTELIMQLREYESGTYGLEEAGSRIKELQKQKTVRDNHIEQLIQAGNKIQDELYQLEQENLLFRQKLGIPLNAKVEVDKTNGTTFHCIESGINKSEYVDKVVQELNDEVITLKLENRRLHKLLNEIKYVSPLADADYDIQEDQQSVIEASKDENETFIRKQNSVDKINYANGNSNRDRLSEIVDENEGLRKGMHEILDSIRHQDGIGVVQIESECLQTLLEALDSRHVSGWYQPGMRLQSRIQLLNGINQALREELHEHRSKNTEYATEIGNCTKKIQQLEQVLEKRSSLPDISILQPEQIEKEQNEEYENKLRSVKEECTILKRSLSELEDKNIQLNDALREYEERYHRDKESWNGTKLSMEKEIEIFRENEKNIKIKMLEYEECVKIMNQSPDEIQKAFAENVLRMSALKIDQEQTKRKYEISLKISSERKTNYDNLSEELFCLRKEKDNEILLLKTEKDKILSKLTKCQKTLNESVDYVSHQNLCNDYNELTTKYRGLLHTIHLLNSDRDNLLTRLGIELKSVYDGRKVIEVQLQEINEELNILKTSSTVDIPNEVAELTKKVATMEIECINTKQHSNHTTRMYDLLNEQLKESETRCQSLENKLSETLSTLTTCQTFEAQMRTKIANIESENEELKTIRSRLYNAEEELVCLKSQNKELTNMAEIIQGQVRFYEHHRRSRELDYDSLQRRVIELQSISDEKIVIDRLTREVSSLQKNELFSKENALYLESRILELESKLAHATSELEKTENDLRINKQNEQLKIQNLKLLIHELQKRFLGTLPLITEELWSNNMLRLKEDYNDFMSKLVDLKNIEIFPADSETSTLFSCKMKELPDSYVKKTQQRFQELSMRIINEGLNTKLQIYEERLEKQDKLITRLEEEMIHYDTKCEQFLLGWNDAFDNVNASSQICQLERGTNTEETQTMEILRNATLSKDDKSKDDSEEETKYTDIINELKHKLGESYATINELNVKIKQNEENQLKLKANLIDADTVIKEKEHIVLSRSREIMELQNKLTGVSSTKSNKEDTVDKLALKATVESLQNIIDQKDKTIKRYQNLLKDCREEHSQIVASLQKEMKHLHTTIEANEQTCNKLKMKLEYLEKDADKPSILDTYLTRIHELEDELNQSTDKINQLMLRNQKSQQLSHSAEEKRRVLQHARSSESFKADIARSMINEENEILKTELKEKVEEVENLRSALNELKKKKQQPYSNEKPLICRDRLKVELDRCKKHVEILEQNECDYKSEIQKLKNQLLRSSSTTRKEILLTAKEEQLQKRVKELEEQLEELLKQESKWKEKKQAKCDEEVEKWQIRKRYEQNIEKLKRQLKECSSQSDALRATNDRLKETLIRVEREKINLENKLKSMKGIAVNNNLVEELQSVNSHLEEEIRVLRRSAELASGNASMQELIENQERKIMALEVSKKGDAALAEELERVHERKTQLQKSNLRLEEEVLRLKMEIENLKTIGPMTDELTCLGTEKSDNVTSVKKTDTAVFQQLKNERKRSSDLEKTVVVLKRVVEKLQAENKKLHSSKVSQLQDKNYVEKLQTDFQKLQLTYLETVEKATCLESELKEAHVEIESLQKLIQRLQNGEEIGNMKLQLTKKNQLLSKIKIVLEKTASREKSLMEQVTYLQNIISSTGIPVIN